MILKQLQTIKKFGCTKESDVTMEDIQKKEQELGVYFPTALKEFYLTFHRDDPIFSAIDSFQFLHLNEVMVFKRKKYGKNPFRVLVFIDHTKAKSYSSNNYTGFIVGDEMEEEPTIAEKCNIEDENEFYLRLDTQFPLWLLSKVAWHQVFASQNVVVAEGDGLISSNLSKQQEYSVIHKYQLQTYLSAKSCNLLMMKYAINAAYVAIPDEKVEQIDHYMQELGLTYTWCKRDGVNVPLPGEVRPPVKKRPLRSIQPAIDLVLEFLNLPKGGLTEDEITAAEQRLGFSFPLPLREVYLQVPQELLERPDTLFPLEELEWDEKKKLFFFAAEQGEPEYAIEEGSSVVYIKNQDNEEWEEWSPLDCFLVRELFENAMCRYEKPHVVLVELPECTKRMLGAKGKLGRHLVSVLPNVSKGCRQQFYTTPAHDILVVRDEDDSTYLASVGREPLKWLEKESKEEFSWLSI